MAKGRPVIRIMDDDREWRRLVKDMRKLKRVVDAGYFPGPHLSRGPNAAERRATVAIVAATHEFGAPSRNIPARPFITQGVERNKRRIAKAAQRAVEAALDGKDVDAELSFVGERMRDAIQDGIDHGTFAPLSERTLEARRRLGFRGTKPLIETGYLRNVVAFRIKRVK